MSQHHHFHHRNGQLAAELPVRGVLSFTASAPRRTHIPRADARSAAPPIPHAGGAGLPIGPQSIRRHCRPSGDSRRSIYDPGLAARRDALRWHVADGFWTDGLFGDRNSTAHVGSIDPTVETLMPAPDWDDGHLYRERDVPFPLHPTRRWPPFSTGTRRCSATLYPRIAGTDLPAVSPHFQSPRFKRLLHFGYAWFIISDVAEEHIESA